MEKTTSQQIAEFEEACNLFGYGTKGRVIGILKSLQAENEALLRKNSIG